LPLVPRRRGDVEANACGAVVENARGDWSDRRCWKRHCWRRAGIRIVRSGRLDDIVAGDFRRGCGVRCQMYVWRCVESLEFERQVQSLCTRTSEILKMVKKACTRTRLVTFLTILSDTIRRFDVGHGWRARASICSSNLPQEWAFLRRPPFTSSPISTNLLAYSVELASGFDRGIISCM
jgi:hypothetical protein